MRAGDVGSHTPQVRPHIRRRDRELYFMISRRPLLELAPEEVGVYESIDGRRSGAEIEGMHPGACERLLRWHEAEILELIPPVRVPDRPHLVVIEPHMDDAVLSAGGRPLHRRGHSRVTILSVVRWSNFTSYMASKRDFLDVEDITELRVQESALVAKLLGAEHRCLDWTDAPIRFWPPERWSRQTMERFDASPKTFVNLFPDPRDVARLADELERELEELAPDELWIPMGLGEHVDHRTTLNACLRMLARARDRFARVPVVLYEDLPYAQEVGHPARIQAALSERGTRLARGSEDITDVLDEKLRAVSIYASQFKLSAMGPRIRALAERAGGGEGRCAEAFHRLEGEPHLAPESRLALEGAGLETLEKGVRALLARRERVRRLAVIALPSGHLGRWAADRRALVAAFPNAALRVSVAEGVAWQAGEEAGGERPSGSCTVGAGVGSAPSGANSSTSGPRPSSSQGRPTRAGPGWRCSAGSSPSAPCCSPGPWATCAASWRSCSGARRRRAGPAQGVALKSRRRASASLSERAGRRALASVPQRRRREANAVGATAA